jgi:hypothetical protein
VIPQKACRSLFDKKYLLLIEMGYARVAQLEPVDR